MIDLEDLMNADQIASLEDKKWKVYDHNPQFVDADIARDALKQLVSRIAIAIDEGLFEDPCDVGFAAGAMTTLAAHLCRDFAAADYYASTWLDHTFPKLEKALFNKEVVS